MSCIHLLCKLISLSPSTLESDKKTPAATKSTERSRASKVRFAVKVMFWGLVVAAITPELMNRMFVEDRMSYRQQLKYINPLKNHKGVSCPEKKFTEIYSPAEHETDMARLPARLGIVGLYRAILPDSPERQQFMDRRAGALEINKKLTAKLEAAQDHCYPQNKNPAG